MIYFLSGFLIQFFYFLPEAFARLAVAGFTVEGDKIAKQLLVAILREGKLSLVFQVVYNGLDFANDVCSVNLAHALVIVPIIADHVVGCKVAVFIIIRLVIIANFAIDFDAAKPIKIGCLIVTRRAAGLNSNFDGIVAALNRYRFL